MSNLSAGKDVIAYCNKCKLRLAHVIVVMKDDQLPGKVTCKTCSATHAYKDQPTTRKKSVSSALKAKKADAVLNRWEEAVAKSSETPIKYSPRAKFEVDQVLSHPTFGDGVVEKNIDNNKIEVIFKGQIKVLIHNR